MKKLVYILSFLITFQVASANGINIDGLYYILDDLNNSAKVTYYMENNNYPNNKDYVHGEIEVPETVSYLNATYTVRSIGEMAFQYCSDLSKIKLPATIVSIESGAFQYCSMLREIEFPISLQSIGYNSFYGCKNLKTIRIPSSVNLIEDGAFGRCNELVEIIVDEGNSWYSSYCGGLLNKDKSVLIMCPAGIGGEYRVPSSVTKISNSAFTNCEWITNIDIPNSVVEIGNSAFENSGIENIVLPDKLSTIERYTFQDCKNLISVTIPPSVKSIGAYAFYECKSLKKVFISDLASWCNIELDIMFGSPLENEAYLFLNGKQIVNLEIPDGVSRIGDGAFSGAKGILSVKIPDSVVEIGSHAFQFCKQITKVDLGNSLTTISAYAFSGCTALQSIRMPDSVTRLDGDTFYGCTSLKNVTLSRSLDRIKAYTFRDCFALRSIIIPDGVVEIDDYAFYRCSLLNNVILPNTLTYIGYESFVECTSLSSIVIPNSVVKIGTGAFRGCNNLQQIKIGYGLKDISMYAFTNAGVKSLFITSLKAPECGYNAFWNQSFILNVLPEAQESFKNSTEWYEFSELHPLVTATELSVDQTEVHGKTGDQIQLNATVNPSDATLDNVFWTSDNRLCATVDANGLITIMDGSLQCNIIAESIYPDVEPVMIKVIGQDDNSFIGKKWNYDERPRDIFTLQGVCIKRNATDEDIKKLPSGLYIIGGKKVVL